MLLNRFLRSQQGFVNQRMLFQLSSIVRDHGNYDGFLVSNLSFMPPSSLWPPIVLLAKLRLVVDDVPFAEPQN